MNLSLPANISKLRKENSMTQEQLAEALGVTFASVSKWERGAATPELNLIAKMADLFGVSLDMLVGFELQNSRMDELEEKIHTLQRGKKYTEAIEEAEKALLRYPNDFKIVYRSGLLYAFSGIERKEKAHIRRGISLLEHAISLLYQNTDSKISEASIQSEIANSYIELGQTEKGLEILKKNNFMGVYDALIASTYVFSAKGFDPKDVEPYLMGALFGIINASFRTMTSYAYYYVEIKDLPSACSSLLWLIDLLESLKVAPDSAAYVDKILAFCYAGCAVFFFRLGEQEKAERYLRRAYKTAKAFDENPTYQLGNTRFCVGDFGKATAYDDLGESAMDSVKMQLAEEEAGEQLLSIWQKICEE